MQSQRFAQQALRRLAVQQQATAFRFVTPAAIVSRSVFGDQRRFAATQTLSEADASTQILAKQRLNRPVAPHLSIYRPQITWYLSALNRVTGVALSGGLYAFGAAYLVAPYIGLHLESAVIAAAFAKWPAILQVMTKFVVAMPFTFHSFNGLRHFSWDTASMIDNKKVNQTGWAVVGLSTVAAIALAFL